MNKINTTIIALLLAACSLQAQTPQSVCYQGLATDAAGIELQARTINIRTTILSDTPNGTAEWTEIHQVQTDDFGLFNLSIGQGTPAGGATTTFPAIEWGEHAFFLKVEMDVSGGTDYQLMGINQMLSVPYALHAKGADQANSAMIADSAAIAQVAYSALNDEDTSPTNEIQILSFDEGTGELTLSASNAIILPVNTDEQNAGEVEVTNGIFAGQTVEAALDNINTVLAADEDTDASNELQDAEGVNVTTGTFNGQTVTEALEAIHGGLGNSDGDGDSTNELQEANEVNISSGTYNGQTVQQVLENINTTVSADGDGDATNELQTAEEVNVTGGTYNGQTVEEALENMNADVSTISTQITQVVNEVGTDGDSDAMNEIQNANEVNVTGGTYSGQDVQQALQIIAASLAADNDDNPTNEIQTAGQVSVTNGSFNGATVEQALEVLNAALEGDDDDDATNEIQDANEVNITGGSHNGMTVEAALELVTAALEADEDGDSTNEIQELVYNGETLGITGGNMINLSDVAFGGPGASIRYPQGIFGDYIVVTNANYQVPSGKTFYLTGGPPTVNLSFGGTSYTHPTTPSMPILAAGQVVQNCNCLGLLIDESQAIDTEVVNFQNANVYTVPTGKVFIVKSGMVNDDVSYLVVNGVQIEFFRPNFLRASNLLSFPAGTTLQKPNNVSEMVLTGYLVELE